MRLPATLLSTTLLLGLAACAISSNKNGGGENVRIATPFGGMHVESNKTTAADLGLALYPGATLYDDKDNHSANVNMNFGGFHLKVQAVSYQSPDSGDKILAFYRKGLAQYGDVLECNNDKPVGQPTVASSGLTCNEDDHKAHSNVKIGDSGGINTDGHQLRAGNPRAFRMVQLDKSDHPGMTKFGLVYLELPRDDGNGQTN